MPIAVFDFFGLFPFKAFKPFILVLLPISLFVFNLLKLNLHVFDLFSGAASLSFFIGST